MQLPQNDNLIPLVEVAKKPGTPRDYVNVLVRRGKLKAKKVGRNWVTTQEWLNEYLASRGVFQSPQSNRDQFELQKLQLQFQHEENLKRIDNEVPLRVVEKDEKVELARLQVPPLRGRGGEEELREPESELITPPPPLILRGEKKQSTTITPHPAINFLKEQIPTLEQEKKDQTELFNEQFDLIRQDLAAELSATATEKSEALARAEAEKRELAEFFSKQLEALKSQLEQTESEPELEAVSPAQPVETEPELSPEAVVHMEAIKDAFAAYVIPDRIDSQEVIANDEIAAVAPAETSERPRNDKSFSAPSVPYHRRSLGNGIHFIARNPRIRIKNLESRISIKLPNSKFAILASAFVFFLLIGFDLAHRGNLTAFAKSAWGQAVSVGEVLVAKTTTAPNIQLELPDPSVILTKVRIQTAKNWIPNQVWDDAREKVDNLHIPNLSLSSLSLSLPNLQIPKLNLQTSFKLQIPDIQVPRLSPPPFHFGRVNFSFLSGFKLATASFQLPHLSFLSLAQSFQKGWLSLKNDFSRGLSFLSSDIAASLKDSYHLLANQATLKRTTPSQQVGSFSPSQREGGDEEGVRSTGPQSLPGTEPPGSGIRVIDRL